MCFVNSTIVGLEATKGPNVVESHSGAYYKFTNESFSDIFLKKSNFIDQNDRNNWGLFNIESFSKKKKEIN